MFLIYKDDLHIFFVCLCPKQDHFVLIVSEFLYLPWKYLQSQVASFNINRDAATSTQSITVSTAETLESHVTEYLKDQVGH